MISHRTPGMSQDLTSTRWSRFVPQGASNTPPAYSWKAVTFASMLTLVG
jgi:hypothetical protein